METMVKDMSTATTMTALTLDRYGPPTEVLSVSEVPVPEVGDDQVLVAVEASSINPADWHSVRGEPLLARVAMGVRAPAFSSPGCDVAGTVVRTGSVVTDLRPGDRVLGYTSERLRGGFAEFASLSASSVAPLPEGVSMVDGACLPLAGGTALHTLRDHAELSSGQRILIVGASGGIGCLAVQIAKSLGAHVTGVCSGRNVEFVRGLGADEVLDYGVVDYSELAGGHRGYDVVAQLGGSMPASQLRRALSSNGRLLIVSGDGGGRWFGPVGRIARGVAMSSFGRGRVSTLNATPVRADLEQLADLVASGAMHVPIDETVTLAEVPAAIRDIETGHTKGKISVVV